MATHITREINNCCAFVRARANIANAATTEHMVVGFVDGIIKQINATASFGTHEGKSVIDSLKDTPFGEVGMARIISAVDAKLKASPHKSEGANSTVGAAGQYLKCWWAVMTASDWAFLDDPKKPWSAKMAKVVERGNSIGCTHPSEQCLKWMMALLLVVHYDELPSYRTIYDKLQELKQTVTAERKPWAFQCIMEFPDDPHTLPEDIFNSAYGAEPPVKRDFVGINAVAESVPLRGNSRLLKGKASRSEVAATAWREIKDTPHKTRDDTVPIQLCDRPSLDRDNIQIKLQASEGGSPTRTAEMLHEEAVLRAEYEMKLAQLRHKHSLPQPSNHPANSPTQAAASPEPSHGIKLNRDDDGIMKLTPRTYVPVAPAESTVSPMPKGGLDTPCEDDLDDHSKAAIKAMACKNVTKKVEAAAKAVAKRAEKKAAAAALAIDGSTLKRPAAAGAPGSSAKAMKSSPVPASSDKATKAPVAKAEGKVLHLKKAPVLAATKIAAIKVMPTTLPSDGSNPAPVHYKTGVIYTSRKQGCFRSLKIRGDNWTGFSAAWGKGKAPSKAAWEKAVDAIDSK